MDGLAAHPLFAQVPHQFVCPVLGAGKDQRAADLGGLEHIHEEVLLLRLAHEIHTLVHGFRRRAPPRHLHGEGVMEDGVGQFLDVLRHGGREEQRLPLGGQQLDHLADVVDEAHVEHGVRFIEHEVLEVPEADVALVDEVEQPSGCRHHDVHSALQGGDLLALFHTAKNDRVVELHMGGIVLDALADLGRQLAGGADDQPPDHAPAIVVGCFVQPVEHGQREGRGFARSGLCHAEDVSSLQYVGNGLGLNGGRGLVTKRFEGPHEGFAQSERMKVGQRMLI